MSTPELTGRVAIVTGASRGLGLEIAHALGAAGARVLMCARDADAVEAAAAQLRDEGLSVAVQVGDVSDPTDVDRIVRSALATFGSLQILVNNAGVYGPMGPIDEVDWGAWAKAVEINLLGSVLMCRAVLAHFRAARYGKIVQLSGGGATAPLPFLSAYAASKAAVVRFAETLAYETRAFGIDVNSVAPGALNTGMLDEVLAAGPSAVGAEFYERAVAQKRDGGTPLETGASLAVFLCSAESDGITGRLLSAVWDPWDSLASRKDALAASDIFTLRRIAPSDRGLDWQS